MSHRPNTAKKMKRLRKALRRTPDAWINLVDWLMDRGYADTAGGARKLILDGKVKSESHILGRKQAADPFGPKGSDGELAIVYVVDPYVPASVRATLRVDS